MGGSQTYFVSDLPGGLVKAQGFGFIRPIWGPISNKFHWMPKQLAN